MIKRVFLLWRPWFWLPAIGSALAGVLWSGQRQAAAADIVLLLLAVGPGICGFAETVNDLCDVRIDKANTRKKLLGMSLAGGSGVVVGEGLRGVLLGRVVALVSAAMALFAAVLISPQTFCVAVAGLALAWMYSAPPVRAKSRGVWGVITQAVGYGPVAFMMGSSMAAAGMRTDAVAAMIVLGLWVGAVGISADLLDLNDDRRLAVRTLAVVLGPRRTKLLALALGLSCWAASHWVGARGSTGFALWTLPVLAGLAAYGWLLHPGCDRPIRPHAHALAVVLEITFPLVLALG